MTDRPRYVTTRPPVPFEQLEQVTGRLPCYPDPQLLAERVALYWAAYDEWLADNNSGDPA